MSKINLTFAELHSPLFLNGTNHGTKLSITKRGVRLLYDTEVDQLYVLYNGAVALVPSPSILSMTPEKADEYASYFGPVEVPQAPVTHVSHPMVAGIDRAQVSDPTRDIVFSDQPSYDGRTQRIK